MQGWLFMFDQVDDNTIFLFWFLETNYCWFKEFWGLTDDHTHCLWFWQWIYVNPRSSGVFHKWKHCWPQSQEDDFLFWISTQQTGKTFNLIKVLLSSQGAVHKNFLVLRATIHFQHDPHIWGSGSQDWIIKCSIWSLQLAMFGRKENVNQRPEQVCHNLYQVPLTQNISRQDKWPTPPWWGLALQWKVNGKESFLFICVEHQGSTIAM